MHFQMIGQDCMEEIWHKEVCVLRVGLMHLSYVMYFYYLLLFFTYMLLLDNLRDLLLHHSPNMMHSISAEPWNVCQTESICIGK